MGTHELELSLKYFLGFGTPMGPILMHKPHRAISVKKKSGSHSLDIYQTYILDIHVGSHTIPARIGSPCCPTLPPISNSSGSI